MILIAASNKDPASLNIREQILNRSNFNEATSTFQQNPAYTCRINDEDINMVTLNQEAIEAQDLTTSFPKTEFIIFISRHSSTSGKPTLSVHTPGNLGPATLGGKPREVSVSPANAMRHALKAMAKMKEEMRLGYEVSYEATHHGPSLDVPVMFTELGSSPEQWIDPEAAKAVAYATMEAALKFRDTSAETVIGIGGPHYNNKFTKIALEQKVAFGHMIPKYSLPQLDKEMLQQCIKKTLEKVDRAVLDWKGVRSLDKPKVLSLLNEIGTEIQKV